MRRIGLVCLVCVAFCGAAAAGGGPVAISELGRSARGRTIEASHYAAPRATVRVLVVGCIHGTERAGIDIADRLLEAGPPRGVAIWVVRNLNPDGVALDVRQNGRGVDLNRNFPSHWRARGHRWDPEYPGPRPFSEPETRMAARLIARVRPQLTIWYHQPQTVVRAWGPSIPAARRYARLARMPFRAIRWPDGTAPNWQNHRFRGTSSFVVELPPGRLSPRAVQRHVDAVLRLAGETPAGPPIVWRRSRSLGRPDSGRLEHGVQLPLQGAHYFTWDPALRRFPNRGWRRWGSDRLLRMLLRVVDEYAAAHPDAPPLAIGDLSRPHGGDFGPRYGLPGHVSHQNGLDVDVYYPRLDRLELPTLKASQIDRRLSQDLVDRFVAAGAVRIFVGPRTGLSGPARIVQVLAHHDNHLHVRIAPR
jgi:Zinc carboxypeptidase/Penicillin-insensitive murein endopeptidase